MLQTAKLGLETLLDRRPGPSSEPDRKDRAVGAVLEERRKPDIGGHGHEHEANYPGCVLEALGPDERGSAVVISQHPNRREPRQIDRDLYTWRHLVENFFGKLKEFKRIAMHADKTDQSFAALIYLCAAVINSR